MKKLLEYLSTIERWVAGISIAAMAGFLFADVFSREIFHYSLPWAQKLSLHLMIFAGCLGVSSASSSGGHLRPEIGDHILPKVIQPAMTAFREFCIACFCGFYFYIALMYVLQSKDFGDVNVITGVPLWIVQAIFPSVFLLMAIKHGIYATMTSMRPVSRGVH